MQAAITFTMMFRTLVLFLVLAVAVGANNVTGVKQSKQNVTDGVFLCSKLHPARNVDIRKLRGNWKALEMFGFIPGIPSISLPGSQQLNTLQGCTFQLNNITNSHLTYLTKDERKTLKVTGAHKTRWQFEEGREFLVISAVPDKLMVWAECKADRPIPGVDSPIPAGDKFLAELTLISRERNGNVALTPSDLSALREKVKKQIGFTSYEVNEPIKC